MSFLMVYYDGLMKIVHSLDEALDFYEEEQPEDFELYWRHMYAGKCICVVRMGKITIYTQPEVKRFPMGRNDEVMAAMNEVIERYEEENKRACEMLSK